MLGVLVVGTLGLGCVREPLDSVCPDLAPGDLVITELRGKQGDPADSYGEWIELYNPTDAAIALGGITVDLYRLDGSGDLHFLVRDAEVEIAAGGYAVLGGRGAADHDFVTYPYSAEESRSLYAAAFIEVASCGALVDRVMYRSLPALGTLSLDGAITPDAALNDTADDPIWCIDQVPPDPNQPQTELGIRGTPGEANRPCSP